MAGPIEIIQDYIRDNVEKPLHMRPTVYYKSDILYSLAQGKTGLDLTSINASRRDYMMVLGEYCITNPDQIRTSGTYLLVAFESEKLGKIAEVLIERYRECRMNGVLKIVCPVISTDSSGLSHFTLLIMQIRNCKITTIEHHDSIGKQSEVVDGKFTENLSARSSQSNLYQWFAKCDKSILAKDCNALIKNYDEQDSRNLQDNTCLDRVIINILRTVGQEIGIKISLPYNQAIDAYKGQDKFKQLRMVTTGNIIYNLKSKFWSHLNSRFSEDVLFLNYLESLKEPRKVTQTDHQVLQGPPAVALPLPPAPLSRGVAAVLNPFARQLAQSRQLLQVPPSVNPYTSRPVQSRQVLPGPK